MTKDDALRLALEALEKIDGYTMSQFRSHANLATQCQEDAYAAIAAIREALEQSQPYPGSTDEYEAWVRDGRPDPFGHLSDADLMAMQPSAQPRRHISYVCPQCDASMVPDEQQEQEPVALETVYETIIQWDEGGGKRSRRELARRIVALYTAPPRREWVGLTEEEVAEITREAARGAATRRDGTTSQRIARAIEARLKEKNQ